MGHPSAPTCHVSSVAPCAAVRGPALWRESAQLGLFPAGQAAAGGGRTLGHVYREGSGRPGEKGLAVTP